MKDKRNAYIGILKTFTERETRKNTRKVMHWLSNMKLVDSRVVSVSCNKYLACWLRKRIIFDGGRVPEAVKQIVHDRLMACGFDSYLQICYVTPPDHVMSPEALAYFLQNEGIPKYKAEAIKFDHGDTPESFKKLADGLVSNVIGQLIAPTYKITKSKNKTLSLESDCCCCC